MEWELRTISARQMSPLNAVATTLERPGSHWAVRMPYENLATDRRARMRTFTAALRGFANRTYVPVYGWTRRGSFPAPELLTNNTFASGTTGWTTAGTAPNPVQTAADGVLRSTWSGGGVGSTDMLRSAAAVTTTLYAPYALRILATQGKFTPTLHPRIRDSGGLEMFSGATAVAGGLQTLVATVDDTQVFAAHNTSAPAGGQIAGDHVLYHYASLSRCALVDNGPNHLQRSDEIDNAYWTKANATVSADATASPNGTTTADTLIEDGTAGLHYFNRTDTRSSVAADWCAFGYFKLGSGSRNLALYIGRDASNYAQAVFQLSGSGTVVQTAVAGDTTNVRAFIRSAGNGWYYCAVVGLLTATTGLLVQASLASGTTLSYTGDTTSGIHCWRVGAAQSSHPTRGMQTTSAGDSDGTLQTGSALHLKGLPASTNGLLLQGDPVEIITNTSSQLVRVRSSLNSDAAGLGYLEFEPPLRVSPLDNAAVIVQTPMCRMMSDRAVNGWRDRMGGFADTELALVEDTYPS